MFKVTVRSLLKHRGFTLINVLGLSIGMAACLLIGLYVHDELGYDRFEGADRVFRVVEDRSSTNTDGSPSVRELASTSYEIGPLLDASYPGVARSVRLFRQTALVASSPDRRFQESDLFFADSTFFDVFAHEFVRGEASSALDAPFKLVLTRSAAERYFGSEDPVGQSVTYDGDQTFEVTAVVEDRPLQSHLHFEMLASYGSLDAFMPWTQRDWHWPAIYTYIQLAPGARSTDLASSLPSFILEHGGEEQAAQRSLTLQPIRDIHLQSDREDEPAPNGSMAYVLLFAVIAILILVTACINFVNLTTALAGSRSREVGVRKALGARRGSLINQFMFEATAQVILAAAFAVASAELLMPAFNALSGKTLVLRLLDIRVLGVMLAGIVMVGLLAGSYPAFLMSAFRPIQALRGSRDSTSASKSVLRNGLVIFQFAVSTVMISSTAVIYSQLEYVKDGKTGFDEEHTLVMELHDAPDRMQYDRLKARLLRNQNIVNVTASSSIPPGRGFTFNYPIVPEGHDEESPTRMRTLGVDEDFLTTFDLRVVDGRDFSMEYTTDTASAFIMNETAARGLGWLDDAIGKRLTLSYDHPDGGFVAKKGNVVGVVQDFHFNSFHRRIEPMLIHLLKPSVFSRFVAVRIRPDDIQGSLAFMETEWEAFTTAGYPFSYSFLDQAFEQEYRADERFGKVVGYFSILAIMIACLGLFGLAAFTAQARTKEIGIRKTMGASVVNIFRLLSRDFATLVGVGFAIAVPVALFGMTAWLEGFAYRISVGPGVFVATALVLLAITLFSVSYHSLKAAFTNPVEALRWE